MTNKIKAYKPKKKFSEEKARDFFAIVGLGATMYLILKLTFWISWLVAYVFEVGVNG